MELQLKHLAPYMPYKLRLQYHNQKIGTLTRLSDINEYDDIKLSIDYGELEHIWMFKPILRPMSDFKNDMGPTIWAMEIDKKYNYNVYMSSGYSHVPVDRYPYPVFNYLIENHFDVFNLIPAGIATDINTINHEK